MFMAHNPFFEKKGSVLLTWTWSSKPVYFLLHYIICTAKCSRLVTYCLCQLTEQLEPCFQFLGRASHLALYISFTYFFLFSCSYKCITQSARRPNYWIMLGSRYLTSSWGCSMEQFGVYHGASCLAFHALRTRFRAIDTHVIVRPVWALEKVRFISSSFMTSRFFKFVFVTRNRLAFPKFIKYNIPYSRENVNINRRTAMFEPGVK